MTSKHYIVSAKIFTQAAAWSLPVSNTFKKCTSSRTELSMKTRLFPKKLNLARLFLARCRFLEHPRFLKPGLVPSDYQMHRDSRLSAESWGIEVSLSPRNHDKKPQTLSLWTFKKPATDPQLNCIWGLSELGVPADLLQNCPIYFKESRCFLQQRRQRCVFRTFNLTIRCDLEMTWVLPFRISSPAKLLSAQTDR